MDKNDYYKTLGIDNTSNLKQIKEAYRNLAFQYHPDKNRQNPDTAEKMKDINEAYAVLSDKTKRAHYDSMRQQFGSSAYGQFRENYSEHDIFRGSDINSVFEEMAKSFGFRGVDEIFKDFYGQGYHSFKFKGSGFSTMGNPFSNQSTNPGNRQVRVPLLENLGKVSKFILKHFGRIKFPENGKDINDTIILDPLIAIQGGGYAYFHKQRFKKLIVKIPPNIREGQKIRLPGMGEEGENGGGPGDLYLNIKIKKPVLMHVKDTLKKLRQKFQNN